MAFGCIMFLKAECDGCGECERYYDAFDDDDDDPIYLEYEDEE